MVVNSEQSGRFNLDFPALPTPQGKSPSETIPVNSHKLPSSSEYNFGLPSSSHTVQRSSDVHVLGLNTNMNPNPLNWTQLFSKSRLSSLSSNLKYSPPSLVNGKLVATIQSKDVQEQIVVCASYVVGSFVGRSLTYNLVKSTLTKSWNLHGDFEMTIHGEGAFIFLFNLVEDRVKVLEHGHVYVANHLFIIRPWQPFVEQELAELRSVPIWITLKNILVHLWNNEGIGTIVSFLGKPLLMDGPTANKSRMSFVRVCVEINMESPLPDFVPVLLMVSNIFKFLLNMLGNPKDANTARSLATPLIGVRNLNQ
ncbi:protein of unknown function DUF4283 [Macleaya cordata]|uniref:DUF4283 domain-containing protein n=1 Tax=Macleaya cordata TaxID=56857 RepID=A0A200Q7Q0_MACCD|nr:protein of unknown function DUF4283 [Macleaya cordata]